MTEYSCTISMDQNTVTKLTAGGYQLYGFKAVRSTGKGSPLVWFKSSTFSLTTEVRWEEQYFAYTSNTDIKPNTKIIASASYAIDLQQTLNITDVSGTGSVDSTSGVAGAISINNKVPKQFTCGISQPDTNGTAVPMCAFPLYGLQLDVIAPIEQVLFMFATDQINTGTVIEKAFSSGMKVDLTGAPGQTRNIGFEINTGWSWDGGPWGKMVQPNANLVPLLIQNSAALSHVRLAALHAA